MRALAALGLSFAIAFGSSNVDIIKELFTNPKFDKAKHLRGEVARRNHDFNIKGFYITEITPLGKGYEFDVFRVSVSSNDDSEHFDLYVYMIEDGIYAVRSLAMTGVIKDLIYHYEKISDKQRKDLDLENLKLTVEKDIELIKFGKENLHKFERIFEIYGSNFLDKNDQIERILKSLHLSHIENNDDVFRIVVGGMVDNIVGFFRVEKEEDAPLMHENLYIMIEKIAPKWYLFKMT